MTVWMASNGTIHAAGCEHARRLRVLGDAPDIATARAWYGGDFSRPVRIAPCARKAAGR